MELTKESGKELLKTLEDLKQDVFWLAFMGNQGNDDMRLSEDYKHLRWQMKKYLGI